MVKGISRQAVVVRSPESGAFEQAIFLLSEDRSGAALHSPEELLALADKLAARCGAVPAGVRRRLRPDLWRCCADRAGKARVSPQKKPRSSKLEKRGSLFVIFILKITLRNRPPGH